MNYFILCHPNSHITSDPCNCNLKLLSPHADKEARQSFSPLSKTTDLNEVTDEIRRPQQSSLFFPDPLGTHSIQPVFLQKCPGSSPGTATEPRCFQRALSPVHTAEQGVAQRCLPEVCSCAQFLHPCIILVPLLSSSPQKASGLFSAPMKKVAASRTCGFFFYLL